MNRRCPSCGTSFSADVVFCGYCGTLTIEEQNPADPDARLGLLLGEFLVVARIADGAMGRVYEGRHVGTRERVAVKVLHRDVATDTVAVERFKREFETAEAVRHPHVVQVKTFGQTPDGDYFMAMEFLKGEELGKVLRREGAQRPGRILRLLCQATLALEHAHSFGVIHRDLKPDNVFLCDSPEGDVVRVLDFGSVKLQVDTGPKLTAFGTTLGSPYYMSPEQAMGKLDVDHRTDVFAMTAILHELATGKVPFEGATVAEILMKIVQADPLPPSTYSGSYPLAFDDVIARGLAKDKTARFASMRELARATINAFGLSGDVEAWAHAPLAAIEDALSRAEPPEPAPFFAPQVASPRAPAIARAEDELRLPTRGSSRVLVRFAVVAVAVAALAGGAAALLR